MAYLDDTCGEFAQCVRGGGRLYWLLYARFVTGGGVGSFFFFGTIPVLSGRGAVAEGYRFA